MLTWEISYHERTISGFFSLIPFVSLWPAIRWNKHAFNSTEIFIVTVESVNIEIYV